MLFLILLVAQVLICMAMGGLVLIQRSEGGALGMGGGPAGFMSARGTGNLLTTLTAWFAVAFFANSIALTIVGNIDNHVVSAVDKVDTSNLTLTPQQQAQASAAAAAGAASSSASFGQLPLSGIPLAGTAPASQAPAPTVTAPAARPAASSATPAAASIPTKLPTFGASASSVSPSAAQIAKAKASVFRDASSSAPSASKAAPPASSASTPSAPASSNSTTPQ